MGILKPGATGEDLNNMGVRQAMLDQYTIKDAIKLGLLEEGATGKDLTIEIRAEVMKSNGGGVYQFDGGEIVCKREPEIGMEELL